MTVVAAVRVVEKKTIRPPSGICGTAAWVGEMLVCLKVDMFEVGD